MKLLKEVEKILKKNFKEFVLPDGYSNIFQYVSNYPDKRKDYLHGINDAYLNTKFKDNIAPSYTGFEINYYIPQSWAAIVEKIVDLCIENDPKFIIHQVKMKFGGVRFYVVSDKIDDIFEIEKLIRNKLYSPLLTY